MKHDLKHFRCSDILPMRNVIHFISEYSVQGFRIELYPEAALQRIFFLYESNP